MATRAACRSDCTTRIIVHVVWSLPYAGARGRGENRDRDGEEVEGDGGGVNRSWLRGCMDLEVATCRRHGVFTLGSYIV
jgi:hypothetical protein